MEMFRPTTEKWLTYKKLAIECLNKNKECYMAQWILQNPDKNIEDYILVHQTTREGTYFYISKRSDLYDN